MEADKLEMSKVELQRLIRDQVQKTLLSSLVLNKKYNLLRSLLNKKQKQIYTLSTICQSVAECEKSVKELYSLLEWEYNSEDSGADDDKTTSCRPILPFLFVPSKYHINEHSSPEPLSPLSSKAEDEEIQQGCDDHESPVVLKKEPVVVLTKLRWSQVTAALCPPPPQLDIGESESSADSETQWEPENDSSDSDFSVSDFDPRPNKKRKICDDDIWKYKRIKRTSRVRNTARATRSKASTLRAGNKSSAESNKMETSTVNATSDDDAANNTSEAIALRANKTVIQSNETSTSESNETSTSESNETSTSESNETSTSESNETRTSESNETSTSESNETSTSESNETSTSESNETSTSESNETKMTKSNKTKTTKSNKTKTPDSNKTKTTKSNKTKTPESNKTKTTKSNKTKTPDSNKTKTTKSNKTKTPESNETKTTESNTSKTNPQANAPNSTPQSNTQTSPKRFPVKTSTVPAEKTPPPKLPEVEITVNMNVLARRRTMCWKPGKITEIITKEDGKVKYKVVFDEMGKSLVSSHHIALDCTPVVDYLVVGTRVVVKCQDDQPNFKPGILAEVPGRKNRMRFLVFFDDHTPLYCGLPLIRLVCKPLADPLDDIPDENHRNYMRGYLNSWPYPLLSHYRVGQTLNIEYNGVQQKCEVLEVDGSLIHVVLLCDKQKEWVYRGSVRLEHMVKLRKEMLSKKMNEENKSSPVSGR